jgi:uncharacterized protein YeaO (DUF488 family)
MTATVWCKMILPKTRKQATLYRQEAGFGNFDLQFLARVNEAEHD